MIRIIQHKSTRYFLSPRNTWTGDRAAARQFPDITSAVNYCLELGLMEVRVFCYVEGDTRHQFTLDIIPSEQAQP